MWTSSSTRKLLRIDRLWDALALLAIAFALWKIFIAPRSLDFHSSHPAPAAVYERLDGGTFHLAQQRGRLVFLDFYASWCTPCKLELPLVQRWSSSHPETLVVPVDVGESRATAADFARRYRLRDVLLDPQSSARALFSVEGFPTIVVVDGRGYVRAKWEGLNPAIGLAMDNAEKSLRN
ncbi:MAG TPA: TlpA disulfide reductase family protein [Candidatus Cybelea sp.]